MHDEPTTADLLVNLRRAQVVVHNRGAFLWNERSALDEVGIGEVATSPHRHLNIAKLQVYRPHRVYELLPIAPDLRTPAKRRVRDVVHDQRIRSRVATHGTRQISRIRSPTIT